MMENMSMGRSMVKEHSNGLMVQHIREISLITIFMDMVHTSGLMAVNTLVIGETIKCMVEEFSNGQMEEDMKETMLMIRKKARVFLNGKDIHEY